jgi:GNAT superfamily N-acetyltransferase
LFDPLPGKISPLDDSLNGHTHLEDDRPSLKPHLAEDTNRPRNAQNLIGFSFPSGVSVRFRSTQSPRSSPYPLSSPLNIQNAALNGSDASPDPAVASTPKKELAEISIRAPGAGPAEIEAVRSERLGSLPLRTYLTDFDRSRDNALPLICPTAERSPNGVLPTHGAGKEVPTSPVKLTFAISLDALFDSDPSAAHDLLVRYYPLYAAAFPDKDEVMDLPTLGALISNPRNTWDVSVFLHGEEIVGGYHTQVAPIGDFLASLGDYLWIRPECRGQGLSQAIYRHILGLRRELGVAAHFGEVNDPYLLPEDKRALEESSGICPESRVRFWQKLGRKTCDAPWIQPALTEDGNAVEHLMLTVHPLSSNFPTRLKRDDYLALWEAFYAPLDNQVDLSQTREKLKRALADQESIPFISMTTPRKHVPQ